MVVKPTFLRIDQDFVYIDKIEGYLRNISKDSLRRSTANSEDEEYIKSFIEYASDKLKEFDPKKLNDVDKSLICYSYYKELKQLGISDERDHDESDESDKIAILEKFLGHLRKVGSYVASVINMKACASNVKYKTLFSNIELCIMKPIIINDQPIYSWEYVIKSFVRNNVDYERFKEECLKDSHIENRLKKVYSDKKTGQLQLVDSNIKTHVYLHAEMSILASMIDQEDKSKAFIAVSKRCCYLCELYIDFARKWEYNIIISGKRGKIYSGWKLPQVASTNFRIGSLKHILANIDRVIENKIKHYTGSLDADSDSNASSVGSKDVGVHEQEVFRFIMGDDFNYNYAF